MAAVSAGKCAMESKRFPVSRGWRNKTGSGLPCNIIPGVGGLSKSECGHIKCDMGHPPGCNKGLTICSCRGVSTIHNQFRRWGKWFDFQAEKFDFFRPGPGPQAARSLAISRLSITAWAGTDHDLRLAVGSTRRGFEHRARLPARPPHGIRNPYRRRQCASTGGQFSRRVASGDVLYRPHTDRVADVGRRSVVLRSFDKPPNRRVTVGRDRE